MCGEGEGGTTLADTLTDQCMYVHTHTSMHTPSLIPHVYVHTYPITHKGTHRGDEPVGGERPRQVPEAAAAWIVFDGVVGVVVGGVVVLDGG